MLTANWIEIAIALLGIFIGWVAARTSIAGRLSSLEENSHAGERHAIELEARLAHATAEARENAQQSQSFAAQLAELRASATAPRDDKPVAEALLRIERRFTEAGRSSEVRHAETTAGFEKLANRIAGLQAAIQADSSFPGNSPAIHEESFTTVEPPEDFAFVPDPSLPAARQAAGDLRAALD